MPEEYILALVSSAVAAGASEIELESSRSQVSLRHDGRPLDFEELVTVFSSLLMDDQARDLASARELARSLHALSQLSPSRIQVITSDSQGSAILEMGSRHFQVRRLESGPRQSYGLKQQETRVEVSGLRRPLVQAWLGREWPEVKLLRQRCGHCPIPILVADKIVNPPIPLWGALALLRTSQLTLPLKIGPAHWTAPTPQDCPHQALLLLGPNQTSKALVIQNGISFDYPLGPCPAGLRIWMVNPRLRRDLGGRQWVRDENWYTLKIWLEQTVKDLLLGFSQQALKLEKGEMLQAAALLDEFALYYFKNWQGDFSQQLFPEVRRWRQGLGGSKERQEWVANYLQNGLQSEVDHYLNLE